QGERAGLAGVLDLDVLRAGLDGRVRDRGDAQAKLSARGPVLMRLPRSAAPRRGAVAPLTAVLLIPLVAMLAFAVDMGYITHTRNELQAAADAAALAGANQLIDSYVSYYLPGLSASAKSSILSAASAQAKATAKTYAGYNSAADVSSLTLLDADI